MYSMLNNIVVKQTYFHLLWMPENLQLLFETLQLLQREHLTISVLCREIRDREWILWAWPAYQIHLYLVQFSVTISLLFF